MQTFLPYGDFVRTAAVLDNRRLGKQRVETLQILRALTWPTYGWKNHPAVRMWRGYEEALGSYGRVICREWIARGHADTVQAKIEADLSQAGVSVPVRTQTELATANALPAWLGDDAVHASHRASLLRKDPQWYAERFGVVLIDGVVPDDRPYVWPVS